MCDSDKPQAKRDREAAGVALRSDLVAACRWNLRSNTTVQAVVDAIVEGEGVPDIVEDLLDAAMLIDRHAAALEGDETLDASAQAEAARNLAEEITPGLSESRTLGDQQAAKGLRVN